MSSSSRYLYFVWFLDPSALPDELDREWNACIAIDADRPDVALGWGDHLARRKCQSDGLVMISSEVEEAQNPVDPRVPVVPVGHEASDEEIGW